MNLPIEQKKENGKLYLETAVIILEDSFTKKVWGIELRARKTFTKQDQVKKILSSIVFPNSASEPMLVKASFNNRDRAISRLKELKYLE